VRYFLDTEYNGFGGALLSLALVPEDGSEEFYVTLQCDVPIDPWVERHVMPYAFSADRQLADNLVYDKALGEWFHGFLAQWMSPPLAYREAAE